MDDTIDESSQYAGLTADTTQDTYDGTLGDGGGNSGDWLTSALTTGVQTAAALASSAGLLNGGKSTQAQTGVTQPVAVQGGALANQNALPGVLKNIPVVGWIIGGILLVIGLFFLLTGSGNRKKA